MNNLRTELWLRESPNQNRLTAQDAFSVASPKKLLGQDTNKKKMRRAKRGEQLSFLASHMEAKHQRRKTKMDNKNAPREGQGEKL